MLKRMLDNMTYWEIVMQTYFFIIKFHRLQNALLVHIIIYSDIFPTVAVFVSKQTYCQSKKFHTLSFLYFFFVSPFVFKIQRQQFQTHY